MSTFDPGLEPPGDWQTPYAPPTYGDDSPGARAAVYLWLCAGIQLALSACCGLTGLILILVGTDELLQQMPADMPNREQVVQMLPVMGPVFAIASVVFLLFPALAMGLLAFKVRSGSRGAILTSMIILGIQTVCLGLMTLVNLLGVAMTRSLSDLLVILLMGGVLALFIKTLIELWAAMNRGQNQRERHPSETGW